MHTPRQWERDGLTMTSDRAAIDVATVRRFMLMSYWGEARTEAVIRRAAEHSIPLSVFDGERQVGYARVVTDYATSVWICDVIVDPDYRGRGIATWLMEVIMSLPEIEGCRKMLITRDAHGLYEKLGFQRHECMMNPVPPHATRS
jgi:GNAT superfamily N-acetyltransferase